MMLFFFFNDTATTEIYTLSLHDALPISLVAVERECRFRMDERRAQLQRLTATIAGYGRTERASLPTRIRRGGDRKSTRLNSSHSQISYAVFCLKKKKQLLTLSHVSGDIT